MLRTAALRNKAGSDGAHCTCEDCGSQFGSALERNLTVEQSSFSVVHIASMRLTPDEDYYQEVLLFNRTVQ